MTKKYKLSTQRRKDKGHTVYRDQKEIEDVNMKIINREKRSKINNVKTGRNYRYYIKIFNALYKF
jgi:hypothetical protein